MVDASTYRFRSNAFVGERTYRLTDDALTWEEAGKKLDGVFYDAVAEVRLAFVPTRVSTNRYRAQIIFRGGGMTELFNTDYRGLGDLAEQNAEYSAFLTELHARLATKGKNVRFRKGSSPLAYAANIALTIFIFAGLAFVFFALMTFGMVWIAVVKVAIILAFIPTLVRFIRRARPAVYDPERLPPDMLPGLAKS